MSVKSRLLIRMSFPRKTSFEMTLTIRNSASTVWKLLGASLNVMGIIAMLTMSLNNWSHPVLIFSGFLLVI